MHELQQLFEKPLGLVTPWKVTRSDAPSTTARTWRHLNFLQYPMYLHPRCRASLRAGRRAPGRSALGPARLRLHPPLDAFVMDAKAS